MAAGALTGGLGSMFAFSTEGFGVRLTISVFLALAVLSLASATAISAFVVLLLLTFFTGWLSGEWVLGIIEDGWFEESSIAAAVCVVVVPPAVVGLGWLVVGVFTRLFALVETPVEIAVTVHPALKLWGLNLVFGVWGSAIGAYPLMYLHARREVMDRRRGR